MASNSVSGQRAFILIDDIPQVLVLCTQATNFPSREAVEDIEEQLIRKCCEMVFALLLGTAVVPNCDKAVVSICLLKPDFGYRGEAVDTTVTSLAAAHPSPRDGSQDICCRSVRAFDLCVHYAKGTDRGCPNP